MTETIHHATDENFEGVYVPKSYQFERDTDTSEHEERFDTLTFDERSNSHFVYENMEDLLETENGLIVLKDMLKTFLTSQKERIEKLDSYSKGNNYTVLHGRRRLEKEKSDYRVRHNWGGYISNFITGFLLGKPVTIGLEEGTESDDLDDIKEINDENDLDSLNFELGFDTSRFGRSFELHYRDEDNKDRIVLIDATEMFIIRDTTVNKKMIGAVHCPIFNGKLYPTVYTNEEIVSFESTHVGNPGLKEGEVKKHFYKDVPVVEWWNNRFRQGDFENELPLIDAYDSAQSDTANYMSDLNDALLVINGDFNATGISRSDFDYMKKNNTLLLETGMGVDGKQTSMSAGYIYKQYDVAGTEAYKKRIVYDIYKLSHVPNLDNDTFNASSSGIALQYKMIGLNQIRATKEIFYKKALRRRYQLIENVHRELNDVEIDSSKLTFVFHENIPQDVWTEVQKYIDAGGEISQETLRDQSSFTDNEIESKRIAKESTRNEVSLLTDEEILQLRGE